MLRQNAARVFFNLAKGDSFKTARAFKAKRKAADAAEQVKQLVFGARHQSCAAASSRSHFSA